MLFGILTAAAVAAQVAHSQMVYYSEGKWNGQRWAYPVDLCSSKSVSAGLSGPSVKYIRYRCVGSVMKVQEFTDEMCTVADGVEEDVDMDEYYYNCAANSQKNYYTMQVYLGDCKEDNALAKAYHASGACFRSDGKNGTRSQTCVDGETLSVKTNGNDYMRMCPGTGTTEKSVCGLPSGADSAAGNIGGGLTINVKV